MPFRSSGSLRWYEFESLRHPWITQAIFTRAGGESPAPWAALNFGRTVGDTEDRVRRNQERGLEAVGRAAESAFPVWQVHSANVVRAHFPDPDGRPKADGVITSNPAVTVVMRFADCVPIFLFDPVHRAIGIVHAGWKGTVLKVVGSAIRSMQAEFQSRPEDVMAGIGPSIGPDHYPVGEEVASQVRQAFGETANRHLHAQNGGTQLDLWSANEDLLSQAGVRTIEVSRICTACHLEDWYSHRGEKGQTGRFGAVFALASA